MTKKNWVLAMVGLMLLMLALFSYTLTFETADAGWQQLVFPTATATPDLIGDGWWDALPTPLTVEPMPTREKEE